MTLDMGTSIQRFPSLENRRGIYNKNIFPKLVLLSWQQLFLATMGQSNSSCLKVSECAVQAGKVAQHLALGEPVKRDLIFSSLPHVLLMIDWKTLCTLENVCKEINTFIRDHGIYLWRNLCRPKFKELFEKSIPSFVIRDSYSHLKLCLLRRAQNILDDEISHEVATYPVRDLLEKAKRDITREKNAWNTVRSNLNNDDYDEHGIYGMVCDLVRADSDDVARVLSRTRTAALFSIVVSDVNEVHRIKRLVVCHYPALHGKLSFIIWNAKKEHHALKLQKLLSANPQRQTLEAQPGFVGYADSLLRVRNEHWFLRGVVQTLFSHISLFKTEQNAMEYLNSSHCNPKFFHYVALDMYDEQIIVGTHWEKMCISRNNVRIFSDSSVTYYRRKPHSNCYRGPSNRRGLGDDAVNYPGENADNAPRVLAQADEIHGYRKSGPLIASEEFRARQPGMDRMESLLAQANKLQKSFCSIVRNHADKMSNQLSELEEYDNEPAQVAMLARHVGTVTISNLKTGESNTL